ncbi:hydantoinase/oxoprolinase family protein [Microvirga massiliensis]|uniref:hydantoinase/oxoprolinase family protein n=1 Tax=Microvirga massiliensis TaxID=1033741 RepID=UPI00062B8899|nr:hydantoinase/oxoprolinase family protein [Microvirga massiliensis]
MQTAEAFKIGVDIGGTFTDITVIERNGRATTHKTPSTPHAPAESVLRGIREALELAELDPAGCRSFVHGSTVGVNTIIQRLGAKVGVLVTKGFEDVLELGRAKMPDPFSLTTMRSIPLSRRDWVRGVVERMDSRGQPLVELDRVSLLDNARELVNKGADALAVTFLNSYRNSRHEEIARELILAEFPEMDVAISTDIWPQIREYERATVVVMNSYIAPKVKGYLRHLVRAQASEGLECPLYMTSSNGGIVPIGHAQERPIGTLLSGPASGIVATLQLMKASGLDRVITMDIGGTSADLCVLEGQDVPYAWDQEVAGLPITLPSVDISSIGAGGGSIAFADNLGLLKVGPQSAGAEPGPVAYGRGGTQPTLTDAYLVSGFIDGDNFLGGRLKLDLLSARKSLEALANKLNLGLSETVQGVVQVATSNLAAECTRLAAKKGIDPREYTLVAFGGAGATHGCLLADEIGVQRIAIPYSPGTFCANGSTAADFRLDYLKTVYLPVSRLKQAEVDAWFDEVDASGRATLAEASSDIEKIVTLRSAGVRYLGQGYEVTVPFAHIDELPGRFREEYAKLYGARSDDSPLEVISIRATVVGLTRKAPLAWAGDASSPARKGARKIALGDKEYDCPVFMRSAMAPGWEHAGPFIVDQPDTTCVVTPGWRGTVDAIGTLHLTKEH